MKVDVEHPFGEIMHNRDLYSVTYVDGQVEGRVSKAGAGREQRAERTTNILLLWPLKSSADTSEEGSFRSGRAIIL